MANTGNIIHPHIVQYFNSGPNSGSIVSSSYIITFSGSFTSSILCGDVYNNSVYDPVNCPISGTCLPPTIIDYTVTPINGGPVGNYNFVFNTNTSSIELVEMEFAYVTQSFDSTLGYVATGSYNIITTGSISNIYSSSFIIEETNMQLILSICNGGDVFIRLRNVCPGETGSYSEWVYTEGKRC